jgi:L-serine dehydratase
MRFEALDNQLKVIDSWEVYSVGGGALQEKRGDQDGPSLYPLTRMEDILNYCETADESYWEYVENCESKGIWNHLETVGDTMEASLKRGLATEGVLPGGLGIDRKAPSLLAKAQQQQADFKRDGLLAAYAYAVAEENATKGMIVTAPTCGACGVLPSVLHYLDHTIHPPRRTILKALATGGLIGNIVKENASISGAEVGCQGEVGTACAMAAGAATFLMGGTIRQIEYAAEMGLEHHLGLTCDPVGGLVQIPCIERNAHAATRALSCCHFALLSDGEHKISFDDVVAVMKETGQALPALYRETSDGGLARVYRG